jgi:phage-related protein
MLNVTPRWKVFFYQDAHGRGSVEEWVQALSDKEQARVRRTLGLSMDYGTQLGMPHSRPLRGKLRELRIAAGRNDYRVLYVAAIGARFYLLHAFSKKTAKTPDRELAIAERRLVIWKHA